MATNITVRTKIRVNGQEFTSVDDMPPDTRQAYERAMASLGGKHAHLASPSLTSVCTQTVSKIVFNGREYASVDQMPAEIRKLYEDVMATVEAEKGAGPGETTVVAASSLATNNTRFESTTSRLAVAAVIVAALILASFVWGR